MRYRRSATRYTLVASPSHPAQLGAADLFERAPFRLAHHRWRPAADVYETPRSFTVMIDVAGVDPDELDIVIFEDALTVAGHRRLHASTEPGSFHIAQIRQGPFLLELTLPARVDVEQVSTHAERGLLILTLTKVPGDGRGR